jgi:hypothetical protein
MERGCQHGLTIMSGAEPLRAALRDWAASHQLSGNRYFLDYCFNWALEQLSIWPPSPTLVFVDQGGFVPAPPRLPAWVRLFESRSAYLKAQMEALRNYCDEIERASKTIPAQRAPAIRRSASVDLHFHWLAGYQVCGWSKNAISSAEGINRTAVIRDLRRLATQIGLTLRPATNNDRSQDDEEIRAALDALTLPVT